MVGGGCSGWVEVSVVMVGGGCSGWVEVSVVMVGRWKV